MADPIQGSFTSSVHSFLTYCRYERGFSPATLEGYGVALRSFARYLEREGLDPDTFTPGDVNRLLVRGYLVYLMGEKELKPASAAYYLTVLRSFYRYLVEEEGFPADQVPTRRVPYPKLPRTVPRVLSEPEVRRLLEAAGRTNMPQRDLALVQFLIQTGCRAGEATGLELTSLDWPRGMVKVMGKGSREREVPITPSTVAALRRYVEGERQALLDRLGFTGSRWVFLGIRALKMSVDELGARFRQIGRLAGLHRRVTPHTLRHTCFTMLLERGVDIRTLQELAGHASLETTQLYTHVSMTQMRAAMEKLERFLERGGREARG